MQKGSVPLAKYKETNDITGVGKSCSNTKPTKKENNISIKKDAASSSSSYTESIVRKTKTGNVKTAEQTQSAAIQRTQTSTNSYSSNKFVESKVNNTYTESIVKKTKTENVKTAEQTQSAAIQRTQTSTNNYSSNKFVKSKVNNTYGYGSDSFTHGKSLKNPEMVINQTKNNYVGTSSYVNYSFTASKPSSGKVRTSMNEDALKSAIGAMNYEVNRKTGSRNIQSASQIAVMAALRATVSTNTYNSNNINGKTYNPKITVTGGLKELSVKGLNQVSKLSSRDDMGTAAVGSAATAAVLGIRGFEVAQKVSEVGVGAAVKTGKGAISATDFVVKGTKTVSAFTQTMLVGKTVTALDGKAFDILKLHASESGLNQTKIAKGLIHSINQSKTILTHGMNGAQTLIRAGVKTGKSFVVAGKITRNVFAGTYSAKQIIHTAGYGIIKGASAIGHGAAKAGLNGIKTTAKGLKWTFVKALPKTGKLLGKGFIGSWRFGAKALMASEDLGLQSVGTAMEACYQAVNVSVKTVKTVKATVKTLQKGGKTIIYAGKFSYRAGKAVYRGAKFIKNNGLKAAWNKARKQVGKKTVDLVKKAADALLSLLKNLGVKAIIPLVIIIIIAVGFNVITIPVMAISGIMGGVFSDADTGDSVNVDDYLNDATKGVPAKTTALKNDIVTKLANAESSYNIVRFRANTTEGSGGLVIEHTYDAISSVFPTDAEIVEMIKPLFQAVILMNYDNNPTQSQCADLLDHIMDKMFVVEQIDTTEYCGQNIETGEGDIDYCESCGAIHAHEDCPNKKAKEYHSSFTCDRCCYKYCPGHVHYESSTDTWYTTYCSGCTDACNGHIDCGGHSVATFTLNCDGIYGLVQEYFLDPIDDLENTDPRTDEQEKQLQDLKAYYEVFEEMAKLVGIDGYSGGLTPGDLSGVHWVNGSRTGCNELVEYAKQFLGNTGGQQFWSNLGFSKRVAWCACFVYYVMQHSGYGGSYPSSTNYAYCQTMANSFSSAGRFADSSFRDIVAGDVIYFDWQGDGHTDHTGIVIGRDDTKVYTIEGNSGDIVKLKSYNLDSSVIYGYGLMNY